jgi:hypothetical protein
MNYIIEKNIALNSLTPLLILAFIGVLIFSKARLSKDKAYTPTGRKVLPVIIAIAFPFLILTSIGPALLAIIGISHRFFADQLTLDFLKSEVISGTMALRISSVIIAYHIIILEIQRIQFSINTFQRLEKLNQKRDAPNIVISETQYLFYGITAAALWQNIINEGTSNAAIFASWALIYILDDWTVIQEYLIDLLTPPSLWLYYKILLFNVLLLVSLVVIFFSASILWKTMFLFIPLLCIFPFWAAEYENLKNKIIHQNTLNKISSIDI